MINVLGFFLSSLNLNAIGTVQSYSLPFVFYVFDLRSSNVFRAFVSFRIIRPETVLKCFKRTLFNVLRHEHSNIA